MYVHVNPCLCQSIELSCAHMYMCSWVNPPISTCHSFYTEYLETAPFDAKAFTNEMITSSQFEATAQQPLAAFTEPAFHELYRDIALVQKWASRKDGKTDKEQRYRKDFGL